MIDGVPSRTALRVAVHRAAHQVIDSPRIFDDPIALAIIGDERAARLRADPGHVERGRVSTFIRAFVVARSRLAEDRLAEAVAAGVRQYVVLGAGLDTFAYRNPHRAMGLRVFEVDFPATQEWKHRRLAAGRVAIPDDVTFVPIDFTRERLSDRLVAGGFVPGVPTCVAWLGVTPYLDNAVVLETIRELRALTGAGSTIVFDYALAGAALSLPSRLALSVMAMRVKRLGEPWQSAFMPADLGTALRERGFTRAEDFDRSAINARYFSGRTDGLRVGTLARLIVAGA